MLSRLRSTAVLISAFFIFLLGAVAACVVVNATTYHTVRINYLFADGTHAHDPYIATFTDGEPVDVTVTNPTINGYDPMTLNGGETNPSLLPDNGMQAKTIEVKYDHFNSDVTYTVYYVAGLSHYTHTSSRSSRSATASCSRDLRLPSRSMSCPRAMSRRVDAPCSTACSRPPCRFCPQAGMAVLWSGCWSLPPPLATASGRSTRISRARRPFSRGRGRPSTGVWRG